MPAIVIVIMMVFLSFATALLFLFPSREVTQPPGRWQVVWGTLLPGTSPSWGVFGGAVLLAWGYLLLQDLFLFWKGSPYLLELDAMPNPSYGYGVPSGDPFRLINPSWVWVYLAPAGLFVVNLALVFRGKLFRKNA